MKKKTLFILLITGLIVVIGSLAAIFVFNSRDEQVDEADYGLNHEIEYERTAIYYSDYIYRFGVKGNDLYIERELQIVCIQAPCNGHVDKFKVEYKDEYKALMEKLFHDKDDKVIVFEDKDLDDSERETILNILREI